MDNALSRRSSRPVVDLPRTVALATSAGGPGGVWRHLEDLSTALRTAGIDVLIGLLPGAEPLHAAAEQAGLPWRPLGRTIGRNVDLCHMHLSDTYNRDALTALARRRVTRGRSVITEHLPRTDASDDRLEPQDPRTPGAARAKTFFKRVEYRLVDAVIAVSTSSARFIEQRYRLRTGSIEVIHNGADPAAYVASPPTGAPPLSVLVLGGLGRQKGVDVLIEAARHARSEWNVTIVGIGPHLESLQSQAARLAPGRITFVGWSSEPHSFVAKSDVVCMPSRWESFPYVALEASLMGRPVVASHVDGLDEFVQDGRNGLLVPPEDPERLAAALDRLADEPELVGTLGRAARARAEQFTLAMMVDKTFDVYRAVRRMA